MREPMMWTRSGKENLKTRNPGRLPGFFRKSNGTPERKLLLQLNREEEAEFFMMVSQITSHSSERTRLLSEDSRREYM